MATISDTIHFCNAWEDVHKRLQEPVEGEDHNVTRTREEHAGLILKAKRIIDHAKDLHNEVTKYRTTPEQRAIGFVLHSEKIEVSVEPYGFTRDWALIELYDEKINWATFKANKVYVGASFFHSFVFVSCLPVFS